MMFVFCRSIGLRTACAPGMKDGRVYLLCLHCTQCEEWQSVLAVFAMHPVLRMVESTCCTCDAPSLKDGRVYLLCLQLSGCTLLGMQKRLS